MEEIAFLNPGLVLHFAHDQSQQRASFNHQSGVAGLLEHHVHRIALPTTGALLISEHRDELALDAAFCWTQAHEEHVWSFVNNIRTLDGGTHVRALRSGISAAIHSFAASHPLPEVGADGMLQDSDLLEGLTAVIALSMDTPRFDGPTKRRLQSPEVEVDIHAIVERYLTMRLLGDRELGQLLLQHALRSRHRHVERRLARRTSLEAGSVRIDAKVYQQQFGARSRNWHESCSWLTDAGLLAQHVALCQVSESARLLDVCCGSGVVGEAFQGRVGETIGLDITPEMTRLASTRLDRVFQGTVYQLPFSDGSFDLVVNREVLHLLPEPQTALSEIFRVLRPGGQFIVGQIVPYSPVDAFWMFRIFKKKQPLLFHMFLEEDLRRLLLRTGFSDLQMSEYFLWESIDRWTDTYETSARDRREIRRLFQEAPSEIRLVHPFQVHADGSIMDRWRWCVYSLRKPEI